MQNLTAGAEPSRENLRPLQGGMIKMSLLLGLIAFGAPALRYDFALSSLTPGLMLVAAAVWAMCVLGIFDYPRNNPLRHVVVVAIICVLISFHIVMTNLLGQPDLSRPLTSLALLAFLLLVSRYVGYAIFQQGYNIHVAAIAVLVSFSLIALFGLLGYAPQSEIRSERPLYPFTEPSHFAFTVMPFLIYSVVTANPVVKMIILAVSATLVILLKSLSLALGLILAAACGLGTAALSGFLVVALASLSMLDLTYFTDRIDFSYANENLSMLVYRQGIELMGASLADTSGWGTGFQRLGFTNLHSPTSNIIYALTGDDVNIRDGGFTSAKIVSEFGVAGLIIVALFAMWVIKATIRLRSIAIGRGQLPAGLTFALSCFVAFSIEMFVRGAGYFTPTALLALAAVPYLGAEPAPKRHKVPNV
jgi:hypothetical protein